MNLLNAQAQFINSNINLLWDLGHPTGVLTFLIPLGNTGVTSHRKSLCESGQVLLVQ